MKEKNVLFSNRMVISSDAEYTYEKYKITGLVLRENGKELLIQATSGEHDEITHYFRVVITTNAEFLNRFIDFIPGYNLTQAEFDVSFKILMQESHDENESMYVDCKNSMLQSDNVLIPNFDIYLVLYDEEIIMFSQDFLYLRNQEHQSFPVSDSGLEGYTIDECIKQVQPASFYISDYSKSSVLCFHAKEVPEFKTIVFKDPSIDSYAIMDNSFSHMIYIPLLQWTDSLKNSIQLLCIDPSIQSGDKLTFVKYFLDSVTIKEIVTLLKEYLNEENPNHLYMWEKLGDYRVPCIARVKPTLSPTKFLIEIEGDNHAL